MRGVGQQRPQGDHQLPAEVVGGGEQLGAELAPAHVRLDAAQQDHVPLGPRRPGDGELGGGPGDLAHARLVRPDHGTIHLEVVEVLRVDGGHHPGVPHLDQVVDDGRGRVRSIVPALERRDQDRGLQVVYLFELDHPTSLVAPTSGTVRTGLGAGPSVG